MIRIGKCLRKSGDSTRTRFKSEHANLSVSEKVSCYMTEDGSGQGTFRDESFVQNST